MPFYPEKVAERLRELRPAEPLHQAAEGTGLAVECGSFVKFALKLDGDVIEAAAFRSNGCGFALAAAGALANWLTQMRLTDLHGLDEAASGALLDAAVGEYPVMRSHCRWAVVEAARTALADLRARRVEEFRGETALVCSCFGVSEDAITELARGKGIADVDEVGRILRAGTGCGSCRMVIREILDQVE